MVEEATITEDEAALYDRQIRLWGLDAQKRLRASSVLLIGLRGLGAEIVKNIVLSGVKSVTLLDHTMVTDEDAAAQFLVSRADIGKNRAQCSLENTQKLNPMVTVSVDIDNVMQKPDDFFYKFNVICATCCNKETLFRLNMICRKKKIKFFAGDVYGYYGYSFTDLIKHEYTEEKSKIKPVEEGEGDGGPPAKKSRQTETIVVKKEMIFTSFSDGLNFDWSTKEGQKLVKKTPKGYFIMQILKTFLDKTGHTPSSETHLEDKKLLSKLRDEVLNSLDVDNVLITDEFISCCIGELSPVCAVVGGMMGQEIIKAVSHKDAPLNNFFFFDGLEGSGMVDKIGKST